MYGVSSASFADQFFRLERQQGGALYRPTLFHPAGSIFVSSDTIPAPQQLERLLGYAGAKVCGDSYFQFYVWLFILCVRSLETSRFYNSRTEHDIEMRLTSIDFSGQSAEGFRSSCLRTLSSQLIDCSPCITLGILTANVSCCIISV